MSALTSQGFAVIDLETTVEFECAVRSVCQGQKDTLKVLTLVIQVLVVISVFLVAFLAQTPRRCDSQRA